MALPMKQTANVLDAPMKKTTPENSALEKADDQHDFEHLMQIKALSHERLAYQRAVWLAEYESLTPEEKAIVDAKFHKIAKNIAAQFGRSRPFIFYRNHGSTSGKNDS